MVYVEADVTPEQRVRLAANLADRFGARLLGLSALAIPSPTVADGMVISAANEVDIKEEPCGVASASTYTITMRRTYAHQPFAHSGLNQIVAHTDCHLD